MDGRVGFEFRPTEAELMGYFLRFKLTGTTSFVDETINDIDIYSFDPWELRFQSKVKSMDPVWYFFCSSNQQTRKTSSGFWKITGPVTEIEDQWGIWCAKGVIGFKKILRFHKGRIARRGKADWVMHEYHLTILPENQRTHVLCRVEYKGDDISFLYDNTTEFSPVLYHQVTNSAASVFTTEGEVSQFPSYDNDLLMLPETDIEEALDFVYDNREPNPYTYTREDCNEHRPKDPVTRIFDDYCSDSDNESTLFGDTSSSVDSVCNPNEVCFTPIDRPTIGREQSGQEYTNYRTQELKIELKITAVLSLFSIIGWITLFP